jgi:hypothetical protein
MRTWKAISRGVGAVVLAACLLAAAGCAGRRGGERPGDSESGRSEDARREGVALPGQNRYLPSEDPRNQAGAARQTRVSTYGRSGYELPTEEMPVNPFPPPLIPPGESRYRVQVLASTFLKSALRLREELVALLGDEVYLEGEREVWRVHVGNAKRRSDAQALRRRLIGLGYEDAFIVESNCR